MKEISRQSFGWLVQFDVVFGLLLSYHEFVFADKSIKKICICKRLRLFFEKKTLYHELFGKKVVPLRAKIQLFQIYHAMSHRIRHAGTIEAIEDGRVSVRILQASACVACKVAGHCSAAESKEKLVEVKCADVSRYQTGQPVVVTASGRAASQALLFAFGLPFLLMVGVLVMVLRMTGNEAWAALSALSALIPYYFLLWLWRERVSQRISFQIEI